MASDIGHLLRDARHSRGFTLSDAARHTGVRETHLAALERNELETYGVDPVYVRGIVRTYAEYLDVDAAALLARYRAGAMESGPRGVQSVVPADAAAPASRGRARRRRPAAAIAGAILLAAVLAGATVAVLSWQGGQRQTAASAGEAAMSEPAIAAVATEAASTAPSETAGDETVLDIPQTTEGASELTMKLEFTDRVWVRVLVDGRNKLEGIMRPGAVTQFTGKKKIQVRIGVPEAVEFSLNGAWYGNVASNYDEPVNVTCTPDSSCKVTKVG